MNYSFFNSASLNTPVTGAYPYLCPSPSTFFLPTPFSRSLYSESSIRVAEQKLCFFCDMHLADWSTQRLQYRHCMSRHTLQDHIYTLFCGRQSEKRKPHSIIHTRFTLLLRRFHTDCEARHDDVSLVSVDYAWTHVNRHAGFCRLASSNKLDTRVARRLLKFGG